MKYRLERCPACQLRPIEEHDLPPAFSSLESVMVTCSHCGTRLTAILTGQADGGVRNVIFKIQSEESPGRG
jgi:C4-type Zn-finger protein